MSVVSTPTRYFKRPPTLFSPLLPLRPRPRTLMAAMETQTSSSTPASESHLNHVVICGGGVIGACTAYFLSQKTAAQITVIEQSSIACAASGKAGGFLALDWCDGGPLAPLARASFNLHRSLAQTLDGQSSYGYRPLHTLSLPLLPTTTTTTTTTSTGLPAWVDGATARPAKTIGTPDTTAQVHPQLFTRTILSAAKAEVVIGEVDRVEVVEGGDARVSVSLKGSGQVIAADAVVLALGPWSSRFRLFSSLFRVSGMKAHSIVLRPRDPTAITPHALFLSYRSSPGAKMLDPEVYPRPTGEVYICGMSSEAEVPHDPEEIVGERAAIGELHNIAGAVSSHLRGGEADVVAEQACFLPCTEDGLPIIGEMPGVKGCFVATGHNCWGILNGPATGAALAELILDGRATTVDLAPFSPSRFLRTKTRGA